MTPKHIIGDNVMTQGFGLAVIREVYQSPEGNTVYRVDPLDGSSSDWLIFEQEISPNDS